MSFLLGFPASCVLEQETGQGTGTAADVETVYEEKLHVQERKQVRAERGVGNSVANTVESSRALVYEAIRIAQAVSCVPCYTSTLVTVAFFPLYSPVSLGSIGFSNIVLSRKIYL